ncbi:hypothetical protein IIA95_03985 [Patescibacteria group bacterium]|nr:hypothetical protein [Patescibacteria group bacterium]
MQKQHLANQGLNGKIQGMEQYLPGDESTKELILSTTSGTTTGKPTSLITKIVRKKDHWTQPRACLCATSPRYGQMLSQARVMFHPTSKLLRVLFISGEDLNNPGLGSIIAEFNPSEIRTSPSYLNLFIKKLRSLAQIHIIKHLKHVYLSGERANAYLIQQIKNVMPQATLNFRYTLAEIGGVGMSCPYLIRTMYNTGAFNPIHINSAYHIDIINPNKNNIGEIVITTPHVSNYRTGDAGKLVKKPCPCGAKQTLLVYGRYHYDIVHSVGATILLSELERIFDTLKDYVEDYLVEVREIDNKIETVGKITFKIVATERLKALPSPSHFIVNTISRNLFITKTQTLANLIRSGTFLYPEVEFVKGFPASNKKIRLKKIFD